MIYHGTAQGPIEVFETAKVSVVMDSDLIDAPSTEEAKLVGHLTPETLVAHASIAAQFVHNTIELVEIDIFTFDRRRLVNRRASVFHVLVQFSH